MAKQDEMEIPIQWHYPEGMISRYANNLVVQHSESEFFISFFEIRPPLIFGGAEAQTEQLEKLDSLPAECVARIVVAADKMPQFIRALESNMKRYLDGYGKAGAEENESGTH